MCTCVMHICVRDALARCQLKEEGNDRFKKADFENAVTKYSQAIEKAGGDIEKHPVLISCYNNRYGARERESGER